MAKDTRIFKVVKYGRTNYRTRTAVSAIFASAVYGRSKSERGFGVSSLEYTNAEATAGWTDCLEEFKHPELAAVRCRYHPQYRGIQKPKRYNPAHYSQNCLCWGVYGHQHPDYPTHWDQCPLISTDPAGCDCQMSKKIFGDGE